MMSEGAIDVSKPRFPLLRRVAALALALTVLLAGSTPGAATVPEAERLARAIAAANVYVTRLSAVRRPTAFQRSRLALYRSRLVLYGARLAALQALPTAPPGGLTASSADFDSLGQFGDTRYFWRYSVESIGELSVSVWDPDTTAPEPVYALVHGGPMATPAHDNLSSVGGWLAAYGGGLAIGCDWRSLPGGWPSPSGTDVTACVAWARENATRYGGDPSRIVLVAHSFGGYPSAAIALGALGEPGIRAYASVAAITSAEQVIPGTLAGLPDPRGLIAGGSRRPMLVVAGSLDRVANITPYSWTFAQELGAAGYPVRHLLVTGADHTSVLSSQPLIDALLAVSR